MGRKLTAEQKLSLQVKAELQCASDFLKDIRNSLDKIPELDKNDFDSGIIHIHDLPVIDDIITVVYAKIDSKIYAIEDFLDASLIERLKQC